MIPSLGMAATRAPPDNDQSCGTRIAKDPLQLYSDTYRPCPIDATECILQEITAVGHRLEAMDMKITDLSTAYTSIRADIASFLDKVTDCLTTVKGQLAILPERDSELQFLRAKITDLEDRSRRDNVCFFGIPKHKYSTDVTALAGLVFSPPLEFQRAHRIASHP
ncbi:hypothetical protein NDU88_007283 [Pleurodeles waltl]|uniref:Uncharacterized protein n=1 Tax=Pleurodeles waltl TaxID=8319 RepID=A0AAV7TZM7_PLEWA|nr:hypothetical protein NDU88_007283 [Pleurodeles waltl]